MVTFSHNFWNGFDRDAFLHGSSMNNEIWWMSQWFPQKWRINGSTREETDIRTTSKGGWLQKSRNQNPLEQHTHTKKKMEQKIAKPGIFLNSFRHFLRFFSFLGPSWSTLIRRVKCLNKRRSKSAGQSGLKACQAVNVQKHLYATWNGGIHENHERFFGIFAKDVFWTCLGYI